AKGGWGREGASRPRPGRAFPARPEAISDFRSKPGVANRSAGWTAADPGRYIDDLDSAPRSVDSRSIRQTTLPWRRRRAKPSEFTIRPWHAPRAAPPGPR